jgi:hypothetical protein
MPMRNIALAMTMAAVVASGCNRSVRLLEPDQNIISEVLSGTVAAPVNGQVQRTFRTFTVGQGGGDVTVTLTSAVQTLPDGTQQTNMLMGLGAGTVTGNTCVVPVTAFATVRPATTPQLQGSLAAGTYCIEVSDVTMQTGPVAFSVTVTHP